MVVKKGRNWEIDETATIRLRAVRKEAGPS